MVSLVNLFKDQKIEIMNISCFINENREIRNLFRWIDLNNKILKIKWVNKSMIICGLRNWKIIRKRIACC